MVDLEKLVRVPVYWGYTGQGDMVRRGVWMHDSKQGLMPYPPRCDTIRHRGGTRSWELGVA